MRASGIRSGLIIWLLSAELMTNAQAKRVRTSRPKYSDTIRFLVNGG